MNNFGLQYVLDNLIAVRPCEMCGAIWFKFSNEGKIGIYRLGEEPPEKCITCKAIDDQVSRGSLMTAERWISREEVGI